MFDTASAAVDCHRFFEKEGYVRITKEEQPFAYEYPDRDSYLYLLKLQYGNQMIILALEESKT
ncbi:MAG: hypothetical protein NC341_11605 [Blautia sp.]|nr:hypothetical protein [Blautia sp.]MCM1202102.1 hypothetical protein [Bacteroides fragilis]